MSSAAPAGTSVAPAPPHRRALPLWQELLVLLTLALVLALVVKAFLVQAFYIPSGSMQDTLVRDDRILVEKVSSWGGGSPARGEIVVFDDPGGWLAPGETRSTGPVTSALGAFGLYPAGGQLVKRVIGVGGDTVRCCDARGRLSVNGTALNEQGYLASGEEASKVRFHIQVPEGHLWVMGDNRSHSADSRAHLGDPGGGLVPVEDVVGRVFAVAWPLGHATLVHRPADFEALDR